MPAVNYFDELGLDAEEILRLSDHDAERRIKKAYSGLYNAHNVNEDNPRKHLLKTAKDCLLNPVTRAQHAEELGFSTDRHRQPQLQPQSQREPEPEPELQPYPGPQPRPQSEWEPRGEAGPSRSRALTGALAAVPAAVVYLAASRINESDAALSFGLIVSLALFSLLGYRWFKLFFLAGLGTFLLPFSVLGFSKVTHAMSLPRVGVVIFTLGVFMLPSIFAAMLRGDSTPRSGWPRHLATVTLSLLVAIGGSAYLAGLGLPAVPDVTARQELTGRVDPPDNPPPSPRETEDRLRLGGAQRRGIQAGLQAGGFYGGAVDGLFGPETRSAIRGWQRTQTGVASGFVDGPQAQALTALAPARPPPSTTPSETVVPPEPPDPVPARSRVVVRAEPDSRIVVDTEARGTTNEDGILVLDGLDPGRHLLVAEKPGYETVTRTIDVETGRSDVVELVLRELPGTLDVRANVDGAFVVIDGGEARSLPLVGFEAPSGTRQVTVVRQGYLVRGPVRRGASRRARERRYRARAGGHGGGDRACACPLRPGGLRRCRGTRLRNGG